MRAFVQKPNTADQAVAARSTKTGRAHPGQNREAKTFARVQRSIGTRAVQRLFHVDADAPDPVQHSLHTAGFAHDLSRVPLQRKTPDGSQPAPRISTPGEAHEREADRIAGQVMRMPDPQRRSPCSCGVCPGCRAEQSNRERNGSPLPGDVRAFFEPRLGRELGAVRIHTGSHANAAARAVNAAAYTVGRDIVFSDGAYAPHTGSGRRLLAHELTHVLQQQRRGVGNTGDGVIHRQPPDYTPGPPDELPLPTRCSIVFGGDKFGPKLKCEGIPGIGSTPEIPLDPRKIPPYIKDKLGNIGPKKPSGSAPGSDGPIPSSPPGEIVLPADVVKKICKDFPLICQPQPDKQEPTLGPSVPFRWLHVQFSQKRPQSGQSLADSLAADRSAIDVAIAALKSDFLVTAILIGNASSEGKTADNQGLSDRRVALVYKEFQDAKVSLQVMSTASNTEDTAGCQQLGFGRWSCGEAKANQDKTDPKDRSVTIVLYRRLIFRPLSLPRALGTPGAGSYYKPMFGPF
jgi:hypothetical protein